MHIDYLLVNTEYLYVHIDYLLESRQSWAMVFLRTLIPQQGLRACLSSPSVQMYRLHLYIEWDAGNSLGNEEMVPWCVSICLFFIYHNIWQILFSSPLILCIEIIFHNMRKGVNKMFLAAGLPHWNQCVRGRGLQRSSMCAKLRHYFQIIFSCTETVECEDYSGCPILIIILFVHSSNCIVSLS